MQEHDAQDQPITPGAWALIQSAIELKKQGNHAQPGLHHWLLALLERHGAMAEAMAQGLNSAPLREYLRQQLRQGNIGNPLDQETLMRKALERAQARGKTRCAERDVAAVILTEAGYALKEETTFSPRHASPPAESEAPSTSAPTPSSATTTYRPRSTRPTPTLERFGTDLTQKALRGKLSPVVGREEEIQVLIEVLCRRTKRNPVLVGPAGVGKTAIVEGFAQRVVRGEVPEILKGVRVWAIQPSTLVAGASMHGELENRMKSIIEEASQEGIILFIDEVHSMIGAGGMAGTGDVASLLKPALARGELACIAATTDEEYRRFIEGDSALERRFQPIRVHALTPEQTLNVLRALKGEFERARGVQASEEILVWLIEFAQRFLRNRNFPDKAIDLLEQCVAYALTQGKQVVEQADAESVAQRMVGMPLDFDVRLSGLRKCLSKCGLLPQSDIDAIVNRLEVTIRGLDLRPARPNIVMLLLGEISEHSDMLSQIIAETLFGSAERVVAIDFSRFTNPADLTSLIGAPPGYVGYSDTLPIHRVLQMPWCVLQCKNIHACHPQVLQVFKQALADGYLTDGTGKRIYLSEAVVILTADVPMKKRSKLGFREMEEPKESIRETAEELLGAELVDQIDLICAEVPQSDISWQQYLQEHLLPNLRERYQSQGVDLEWDSSFVEWLLSHQNLCTDQNDWERLVDEKVSPRLVTYLPDAPNKKVRLLLTKGEGNTMRVALEEGN